MKLIDASAAIVRPIAIMYRFPIRSARRPAGHWPMAWAKRAAPTMTPRRA